METFNYDDDGGKAPRLTDREKALRDQFVTEYMKDHDAYKSCIRIGYTIPYAAHFSKQFMNEPYVLQRIEYEERLASQPTENTDNEKAKIITALWREANNFGAGSSQAARVAALARLSAIHGIDAPVRSKTEITTEGQGIFVLPGLVTSEDWAKQATEQQDDLTRPPEVVRDKLKQA